MVARVAFRRSGTALRAFPYQGKLSMPAQRSRRSQASGREVSRASRRERPLPGGSGQSAARTVPPAELSSRTSLTTSALSRDTLSVQAAGAGSQKPRVGGGGRTSIVGQRFPVVHASTLACVSQHQQRGCPQNISSVTTDHDTLCVLTSH